jgi:hypothetical protein
LKAELGSRLRRREIEPTSMNPPTLVTTPRITSKIALMAKLL